MSDQNSTYVQFSRNKIIRAIIETLETRKTHSSPVSVLNILVCRNLDVLNTDHQLKIVHNQIQPAILSLVHANIIEKIGNSRNLRYLLSKNYLAKLSKLIERHDCEIVFYNSDANGLIADNPQPLPDLSEPPKTIQPDKKSNTIQFTRNELLRAVVETLENHPNHSCMYADIEDLVCEHLQIRISGQIRSSLNRHVRKIVNSLVYSEVIDRYQANNKRYSLSKGYQIKLRHLFRRKNGNDIYFDSERILSTWHPNLNERQIDPDDLHTPIISPYSLNKTEQSPIDETEDDKTCHIKFNIPDLPDQVDPSFYKNDQDENDWGEEKQQNEDFDDSDIDPLDILMGKPINDPNTDQLLTPTTHISTDDFTFKALRSMIASYIENHPDFESDAVRNKIQMITCMEDVNIFITIAIDRHTSQVTFRAELQNLEVSPEDILNASAEDKFNCIPGCTKSNNHPLIQLRRLIPLLHIDSSRVVEAIDDIVDDSETLIELRRSGS